MERQTKDQYMYGWHIEYKKKERYHQIIKMKGPWVKSYNFEAGINGPVFWVIFAPCYFSLANYFAPS